MLPRVERAIVKLPVRDIARIREAILGLPHTWMHGKKLEGEYAGARVIRVWPYRIIYEVRKRKLLIVVLRVADRKDAYR